MKKAEAKINQSLLLTDMFFRRDERAIELCAESFGHLFYQIAMNITGDRGYAEEIVNDTYLKLWNSIPPAKPDSLSGYGCKIARNFALSKVRAERAQKRPEVVAELDEAITDNIPDDADAAVLAKVIERFLDSLKERDRTIFIMRYFEEQTSDSIAEKTGISPAGVRTLLKRLREKLKGCLEKEGFSP